MSAPNIYLNQAGTSWPIPECAQKAMLDVLSAPTEDWSNAFGQWHRDIAQFFHIPDKSRLLLTPTCTTALNLAIGDFPLSAGDKVLSSHLEHHAMVRPLKQLEKQDVKVIHIRRAGKAPFDMEELEKELKSGGVRLVALAAACNVNGEKLPVMEIMEMSHRYDAKVLVDAAQIAGWWDLDVSQMGADLFCFAGHKAPNGPWGVGGLYVAPDLMMNTPSAVCEITSDSERCSPMPSFCDAGSVDLVAIAGLAAAVRWLSDAARSDRLQRAQDIASQLVQALSDIPGVTIHSPLSADQRMPTVAITVSGMTSSEVGQRLKSAGIIASSGLQCAPLAHQALGTAPDGVVRLSVGISNTPEEIELAIERIQGVLSKPLYKEPSS